MNEVYYEYMEYEGKQVRGYNTIVYYENTMKKEIYIATTYALLLNSNPLRLYLLFERTPLTRFINSSSVIK